MRSTEHRPWALLLVLLGLFGFFAGGVRAQPVAVEPTLTAQAVMTAASAVQADPLMPGVEKVRTLRFKRDEDKHGPEQTPDFGWWGNFLASLTRGARVAVWLLLAGGLALVLLRLRDWLQLRGGGPPAQTLPPSHVGSLDIRPESLPADIGAAARLLAQQGELRAALSLLYRGALSRLVHQHGVPIRAASTEGECLALAAKRLTPKPQLFLAQLISCWQGVAYAQRLPSDGDLELLCAGFDKGLLSEPSQEAV